MRTVIEITFFPTFPFFIASPIIISPKIVAFCIEIKKLFKHNLVKVAQESLLLVFTRKMMTLPIERRDNNVNREQKLQNCVRVLEKSYARQGAPPPLPSARSKEK